MSSGENVLTRQVLGEASFSVSARIAVQLGRESISNSIVAILELVKNSYDADADNVWIRFARLGMTDPLLIIEDDGTGMTQKQLVDNWMVIGTDNKLGSRISPSKKRVLTGEKGLGRLGLDRLCALTSVQSFTQDTTFGLELDIDWSKYEVPNVPLEMVRHTLYQIPKLVSSPVSGELVMKTKGMRLELRGLKDRWSYDDLRRLRRELGLLVSPFAGVNDFAIWLMSGSNLSDVDGQIGSSEMLEAAQWKVVSTIDASGYVKHTMSTADNRVRRTFHQAWSKTFRDAHTPTPRCGPLEYRFYFIPRQEIEALSFKRAEIESFLNANQGIRIYRDGFRVKPYGDPAGDGDWLNLAYRRMQSPQGVRQPLGTWRVGYNQIVGAVFLTRDQNPALLDQTNREGIIEGPAFHDLRRFALHSVSFFETERQRYEIHRAPLADSDKARDAAESVSIASSNAVKQLKESVDTTLEMLEAGAANRGSPDPATVRDLLNGAVAAMVKAVSETQAVHKQLTEANEEQKQELERQKNTLGNLASLGILAAAFGHETQGASNIVVTNAELLKHNLKLLLFVEPNIMRNIVENLDNIQYGATKIETFAHFVLQNVRRDKRQRVRLAIEKVARNVLSAFEKPLREDRGITLIPDFPEDLTPILAYRIDWESIFINLITNAVWALEDTPQERRIIRIRMGLTSNCLQVTFADSGRGIEAGTEDRIFMPTFSTKRNDKGDVVGTGMGLSIVKSFVESYDGTVRVQSPSDLGGAEFHIEIPLGKSSGEARK